MSFDTLKAYLDLTRLHFFIVWPLLFCSGLFLSFLRYAGFSWMLVAKAALIALFGFEAGFVLNDYVDAEVDERDIEQDLTKYWRPFGSRPIPSGKVSRKQALALFLTLAGVASVLIFTLPYPHSVYVFVLMLYAYGMEYFYQIKKRDQSFPLAQLLGRTDFSLFPVAGYLVNGHPDATALFYFLFFYPFAQAHLGINDIIDYTNDAVRKLKTIPILYGVNNTKCWILFFTVLHVIGAAWFFSSLGGILIYTFIAGVGLLLVVNILIQKGVNSSDWLKALPVFHFTMLIYVTSLIAYYFI